MRIYAELQKLFLNNHKIYLHFVFVCYTAMKKKIAKKWEMGVCFSLQTIVVFLIGLLVFFLQDNKYSSTSLVLLMWTKTPSITQGGSTWCYFWSDLSVHANVCRVACTFPPWQQPWVSPSLWNYQSSTVCFISRNRDNLVKWNNKGILLNN